MFVLAKCHRSAMPLWFHWVFESQRRRHARLVSIGAGRRRRDSPVPAPAPGLDHDYGQITTSVVLLGVQVTDVRRGYLGGRRRRRRRLQAPAPAPASPTPGLHHNYGQITTSVVPLGVQVTDVRRGYLGGRRRRRRRWDYVMTVVLLGVKVTDVRRGYLGGRRRGRRQVPAPVPALAPGLDHDYGQITTSVVVLGVQVTDVRRGYLGGRQRRQVPAPEPAPAPGLHHDYGQITTSVVLLGAQVTDVRRGYLGGRRRWRRDYIMTVVLLGAVILPVGYEVVTHQTVLPGHILAVQARIRGAKIRIVTVYLHPDNVRDNMQALIKYLHTIDLREWTILAGDFNRADEQCSKQWHELTEEYGLTDSHPSLPTLRAAAAESCLDRILYPTAFLQNLQLRSSTSVRWIGDKLRHGIVTLRLEHKATVPPDSKLPKHHTIPPYIFRPGMEGPVSNRQAIEAIQDLERRIMQEPKHAHTTDSLTALYWAWWRTLTPDHKRPQADIAALVQTCLKQKGVHVRMRAGTFEALTKSTGTAIDSRPIEDGTQEVARTELYKALELLDAQAITDSPQRIPQTLPVTEPTQHTFGNGCENSKLHKAPTMAPSTEQMGRNAIQCRTLTRR